MKRYPRPPEKIQGSNPHSCLVPEVQRFQRQGGHAADQDQVLAYPLRGVTNATRLSLIQIKSPVRQASFAGGVRPPTRGSRLGNAIRCQGSTRSSHSRRRRRRASPARARSGLGQARSACEQDPHAQGPEHRPHAGWPRGGLYRARRGAHAASRGSGNATPSRRLSASWRRAARKRRFLPKPRRA